jgi:pyridoxal phosphate enzyme (YggS family)
MIDPAPLRSRHEQLLTQLRDVADTHGHDPARLRIVAVTKTHPIALVRAAWAAGMTTLGESRVQEAEPKIAAVPDAEWHLVGRLQANKVRRAVRGFAAIHSVDSEELLERIVRIADEEGRRPRLLLEVNVSGEGSKAGLAPDRLRRLAVPSGGDVVGLMTIAPMGVAVDEARDVFRTLRVLRDDLSQRLGRELPELSMGMSADAEAAAAEGATLVRIGTALFGPRP